MAIQKVSATTMNIKYNTQTSGVNIETTYELDTLNGEQSGDIISSSSITSDRLSLTFNTNTTTKEKQSNLTIKSGEKIVGVLTINQKGAPNYIWIEADGQTAATKTDVYSATSYTFNILTNYTQDELDNLTKTVSDAWIGIQSFTPTQLVIIASTNTSTTERNAFVVLSNGSEHLIEANVIQQGKPENKFIWDDTSSTATTSNVVNTATTSLTKTFSVTGYTNISVSLSNDSSQTITTGLTNNTVSVSITGTTGVYEEKRATINVHVIESGRTKTIGTWKISLTVPSIQYQISGNFSNNQNTYGNFYVEVNNQTHQGESVTLNWPVSPNGNIQENKGFKAYVGDVIKFTLNSSMYPATLQFEFETKMSTGDPIETTLTMTSNYTQFNAAGEIAMD